MFNFIPSRVFSWVLIITFCAMIFIPTTTIHSVWIIVGFKYIMFRFRLDIIVFFQTFFHWRLGRIIASLFLLFCLITKYSWATDLISLILFISLVSFLTSFSTIFRSWFFPRIITIILLFYIFFIIVFAIAWIFLLIISILSFFCTFLWVLGFFPVFSRFLCWFVTWCRFRHIFWYNDCR